MASPYVGHGSALYADGIIVGDVTSWSYSANAGLIDVTSLGDTAFNYTGGLTDGSFNCEFTYDNSNAPQVSLRQGTSPVMVIDIAGDGLSNAPLFSGIVTIETFDISGGINEIIKGSISGKGQLEESTV